MIISRISPISLARIEGWIYAAIGLVTGLIVAGMVLFGGEAAADGDIGLGLGLGIAGVLSIILYPLVMGMTGFLSGLITAILYNLVVKRAGGLEIEVEEGRGSSESLL